MPLQVIPLDQSIYKKPQRQGSPISQALTPSRQGGGGGGISGTSSGSNFMDRISEREALEGERKYEEKMMKLQHEQEMERLKFTAGLENDARKSQATMGNVIAQAEQKGAQIQQIEDNPEPAAKEMYELLKTLPDEAKQQLLQQIFTPTGSGGTVSSGGKTIQIPGKYNPIAQVFVDKGWAMFDAKGNVNLSEPEREFEKGTFKEMSDGSILNEATGEIIAKSGDIPPDWGETYTETLSEGLKYIGQMYDASWMQTMDTDEMKAHSETKQAAYRDWVANRLYSKGMTDKKEINKLADLAVASYNWQKEIDDAIKAKDVGTTTPPTNANRGLPLNEQSVTGLKEVFAAHPEALDDLDSYRNEYGDASVDAALKKEIIPTTIPIKPTTLSTTQKKFQKESYGKYKKL